MIVVHNSKVQGGVLKYGNTGVLYEFDSHSYLLALWK